MQDTPRRSMCRRKDAIMLRSDRLPPRPTPINLRKSQKSYTHNPIFNCCWRAPELKAKARRPPHSEATNIAGAHTSTPFSRRLPLSVSDQELAHRTRTTTVGWLPWQNTYFRTGRRPPPFQRRALAMPPVERARDGTGKGRGRVKGRA